MHPTDRPFSRPEASPENLDQIAHQREVLARAGTLLSSSDFRWFRQTAIEAALKEAEAEALSIHKTAQECEVARHVAHTLRELNGWLEKRLQVARECIRNIDKEAQP